MRGAVGDITENVPATGNASGNGRPVERPQEMSRT
jgi:hypothetical protein